MHRGKHGTTTAQVSCTFTDPYPGNYSDVERRKRGILSSLNGQKSDCCQIKFPIFSKPPFRILTKGVGDWQECRIQVSSEIGGKLRWDVII